MTSNRPAPDSYDDLGACRAGIDAIDVEIMALMAERTAIVHRVTAIKARDGIAAAAPTRAAAVINGARTRAEAAGVDPDLAEALWSKMVDHFIAEEEAVLGKGGADA